MFAGIGVQRKSDKFYHSWRGSSWPKLRKSCKYKKKKYQCGYKLIAGLLACRDPFLQSLLLWCQTVPLELGSCLQVTWCLQWIQMWHFVNPAKGCPSGTGADQIGTSRDRGSQSSEGGLLPAESQQFCCWRKIGVNTDTHSSFILAPRGREKVSAPLQYR